jgi:protein TonB
MSKLVQFSGLIGLSAALHVAAFWGAAPEGGGPSGAGGQAAVTLVAASASLSQAVEQWDRMAETVEQVTAPTAPPLDERPELTEAPAMDLRTPDQAQPSPPLRQAALPIPSAPLAPAQPEAAAPPPPQPAPEVPRVRPIRRPEPPAPPAPQPAPPRDLARPAPVPAPEPAADPPAQPTPDPAAEPAPASAPQPAARAAGDGGGAQAGRAAQSGAEAPSQAQVNALKARWGAGISNRIHRRQRYPSGTRAEGIVHLVVTVATDGTLAGVRIARSSGDARLDAAALRAAESARLPAAPRGMPAGTHGFSIALSFKR